MNKFEIGMYVRVPIDNEDKNNPRRFAIGQIEDFEDGKYLVVFHKNYKSIGEEIIHEIVPTEQECLESEISRCKILKGSAVIHYYDIGRVISCSGKNEDGYYEYYIKLNNKKIDKVSEKELMVDFNRGDVDPIEQMCNYEFHNPFWYSRRKVASEAINMMNNFGDVFKTLIGARAFLFEHQIDTIVKGISDKECRLMLADEVGLGKTVEALVILKGLMKRKDRILLIIPEALVNQWQNELKLKLWMESEIYNGKNLNSSNIVIVPTELVIDLNINDIKSNFNYCVIDEVHRAVGEDKLFNSIFNICKNIKNVLLLSATPIQNRKEEYLKLLKLLKPTMYCDMTEEEFTELYEKNSNIRKLVHRAYRDLKDAYGDEPDEDIVEEIYEGIEEIADELNDNCLSKMFDELDIESDDLGEEKIREILAYISLNYQFEKNIIRHRREELKDVLPKRSLETVSYEMKSGYENYYESNCYEALIEYINGLKDNLEWSDALGEYIRVLLNSMFSSPWALKWVINERKKCVESKTINNNYKLSVVSSQRKEKERIKSVLSTINSIYGEGRYLEEIDNYLERWAKAAYKEITNIETIMDDPDNIKGRFGKVIDYIEQELYDKKVVIFTSWSESLEKLNEILIKMYGEGCVSTFFVNNDFEELESNVYRFQNDSECRFMLCDELGGEGRNFQIADAIIHLDIPFSPTILEQRIGRLDRIGRDKDKEVINVVVKTEATIEESLFDLWNEGLNIFNESLSGLEIALEDINKDVLNALRSDLKYGLGDSIENIKTKLQVMKKNVEEERYYDMASQLDRNTKKRYESIINHFDKDGGGLLAAMMLQWSRAVGFTPVNEERGILEFNSRSISEASMINAMFAIPDTTESLNRSKKVNTIRGTFDRRISVNKEDLVFFAPGEQIFDSIMKNVEEGFRGKCTAIQLVDTGIKWEGFIIKWNTNFNLNSLLDKGLDLNYTKYTYGTMPVKQYISAIGIGEDLTDDNEALEYVLENIDEQILRRRAIHLGKREKNVIALFKKKYSQNQWINIIKKVREQSLKEVSELYKRDCNIKKLKREFAQTLAGAKASVKYFDTNDNCDELKEALQAILGGIAKPEIYVDSIIYINME